MRHRYGHKSGVKEHVVYKHTSCCTNVGTPEVLVILQPCTAGVEVLHVPPRRREACHFVGSEQNPQTIHQKYDRAVWWKLQQYVDKFMK